MRSLGDRLLLGQLSLAGVWSVPQIELLQALDAERARLLSLDANEIATARERRQALLAKYDLNKNGTFDPEEKAAALDDSLFLASELDAIDKNGNGRLDPEEFKYFDPQKKGLLTPKAVAGIELTMRLLAQTLLEKFDDDRDGQLDAWEFAELLADHNDVPFTPPADFVSVDKDHNGKVSLDELHAFFERQTRALLVRAGRGPTFAPVGSISQRPLKDLVETYWATAPPDVGRVRRIPGPSQMRQAPDAAK
jgi:Ca2+-binding EF-hand superfamily protein